MKRNLLFKYIIYLVLFMFFSSCKKAIIEPYMKASVQNNEIVYCDFEKPSYRSLRPGSRSLILSPSDEWASQSPLDNMFVWEGNGADGTSKYLVLIGNQSKEFYAESTPFWWTPSRTFDLCNTRIIIYLTEIEPLSVNADCFPRLFLSAYDTKEKGYITCVLVKPLKVGKSRIWMRNEIDLAADPSLWRVFKDSYILHKPRINEVIHNVGFIGIIYHNLTQSPVVSATGILGIDEFRYNIPIKR